MSEKLNTVNYEILKWAREILNLSIEQACAHLKFSIEKIVQFESGQDFPTYVQLEKMATFYKKPIGVFFFPEPPNLDLNRIEFRTIPNYIVDDIPYSLIKIINDAKSMQFNLDELYSSEHIYSKVNEIPQDASIEEMIEKLRFILNASILDQTKLKDPSSAFEYWREKLWKIGVYVFKEAFQYNDICGFCLYDYNFPVIYVNNQMSFTRQIFTLFHELGHLIYKVNGIDIRDDDNIIFESETAQEIEQKCNSFAAEFLVPKFNLLKDVKNLDINETTIETLSIKYSVSREVILIRLLNLNKLSYNFYFELKAEYESDFLRSHSTNNKGGNYYNTKKSYLGKEYITLVNKNYHLGKINNYQASEYLKCKISKLDNFGRF